MNPFVNRLRTVSIFPVKTLYVTVDTATTTVTYGICPKVWKALPCDGFLLLNIANTVPATATDAYTAYFSTIEIIDMDEVSESIKCNFRII